MLAFLCKNKFRRGQNCGSCLLLQRSGEHNWISYPYNDIKNRKCQEIMAKNKEKEKTGGGNASFSSAGPRDRYFFVYFARWAWARAKTLRMSTARVMGPTPPGTGVM